MRTAMMTIDDDGRGAVPWLVGDMHRGAGIT